MSEQGGGGEVPDKWWRHRDGRWYPPSGARHPAARAASTCGDSDDDEPVILVDLRKTADPPARRSWMAWVLLLGPMAVVAGLVVGLIHGSLETGRPRPADTYTAGGAPGSRSTSSSTSAPDPRTAPDAVHESVPGSPSAGSPPGGPGGASTPDAAAAASGGAGDPGRPQGGGAPAAGSDLGASVSATVSGSTVAGGVSTGPGSGTGPDATSTGPAGTQPTTPQDKDDCRYGGWEDLVDDRGQPFPNQGRCIAWVEAHAP